MQKHTINIHPEGKEGAISELIIREGEALPVKEPNPIWVSGVLMAPASFLEGKKDNYDSKKCHVLIDRTKNEILFVGHERSGYEDKVKGSLKTSNELEAFCINQDKKFSISEFRTFLRTVKFCFADPEEHSALLKSLESFSMNVSKTFENFNNNSGNSKYMIETAVNKIPFKNTFTLLIPIFKGYPKERFTVEIGLDPTSTDVKIFLVSSEIYEIVERRKEKYIEEATHIFWEFGCSIIEVD